MSQESLAASCMLLSHRIHHHRNDCPLTSSSCDGIAILPCPCPCHSLGIIMLIQLECSLIVFPLLTPLSLRRWNHKTEGWHCEQQISGEHNQWSHCLCWCSCANRYMDCMGSMSSLYTHYMVTFSLFRFLGHRSKGIGHSHKLALNDSNELALDRVGQVCFPHSRTWAKIIRLTYVCGFCHLTLCLTKRSTRVYKHHGSPLPDHYLINNLSQQHELSYHFHCLRGYPSGALPQHVSHHRSIRFVLCSLFQHALNLCSRFLGTNGHAIWWFGWHGHGLWLETIRMGTGLWSRWILWLASIQLGHRLSWILNRYKLI